MRLDGNSGSLYIGLLSIASTKRCHQSTAKIQSFFLLILSLFIPQRTNIKSHISTTFITMFCQRQYSNKYIEIGCLLKESLANPNARQLVFEDKREKFIFSENVLPNRETFQVSSSTTSVKIERTLYFVVELQVEKHLDRAKVLKINLISFKSRPYKFSP